MEFQPGSWDCFPLEEFGTAAPREVGALNMELLMQVRPNGRMLDHFRVCLGGSRIIDTQFPMAGLFEAAAMASWKCWLQIWPKDVDLRRNMASTGWKDVGAMIASRDLIVVTEAGETVEPELVTAAIQECGAGGSVRFSVVVSEDQRFSLQLQGLPATANMLMGKPAFRG
jgi:hypothetical protein